MRRTLTRARPPDSDTKDLEVCATKERTCTEKCSCGKPVRKVAPIDGVERIEQSEVCAEHLHRYDIVHRQSSGLHGPFDPVHDQFRFGLRVRGHLPGLRVYAEMAGDVRRGANNGEIADRRWCLRRAAL